MTLYPPSGEETSQPSESMEMFGEQAAVPQPVRIPVRLLQSKPLVSYILVGITVFVYILQFASQQLLGIDIPVQLMVKYNPYIEAGEIWRLITPLLLHGSLMHIGFNMYALLSLGPSLEGQYGRIRFLALYLLTGLSGNVLSFIMSPNPSLGASTAIFGLITAQLVFLYQNREFFGEKGKSMMINTLTIIVINLGLGLTPGIDNWGHLGGLLGGMAFTWFAGPILTVEQRSNELVLFNHRSSKRFWLTFLLEFTGWLFIASIVILVRARLIH